MARSSKPKAFFFDYILTSENDKEFPVRAVLESYYARDNIGYTLKLNGVHVGMFLDCGERVAKWRVWNYFLRPLEGTVQWEGSGSMSGYKYNLKEGAKEILWEFFEHMHKSGCVELIETDMHEAIQKTLEFWVARNEIKKARKERKSQAKAEAVPA